MSAWLLAAGLALQAAHATSVPAIRTPAPRFEGGVDGPVADQPWWSGLNDPNLDALVREGLAANGDLATVQARADQLRAVSWTTPSAFLPALSFDVARTTLPYDDSGFGSPGGGLNTEAIAGLYAASGGDPDDLFVAGPDIDVYHSASAKLNGRLGVDLFGRNILAWRASVLDAQATQGDSDDLALTVSVLVAEAYWDVVGTRQQMAVVQGQLTAARQLLEIVQLRFERGEATALDVLQQQQSVHSAEGLLPATRRGHRLAQHRLALLLGRPAADHIFQTAQALPAVPPTPATGTPEQLLARRPDLRAARDRYQAAVLRRTGATLDLLPTFAISGSAGREWITFDETDERDTWALTLSASMPLFAGGARHAGIRAAKSGLAADAWAYDSTIRSAVQAVEGALVAEEEQRLALEASLAQRAAARAAYDEAKLLYAEGQTSYIQLLTAENARLGAELGAINAQRSLLSLRASLHQALGARWTATDTAASGDQP